MKFADLMEDLLKAKKESQRLGLKEKTIRNLEIVHTGLLGGIEKRNFEVSLAKDDLRYYLLIKDKK